MRRVRHRKLTSDGLAILCAEVDRRLAITPYKTLAEQTGLTIGGVQQLMAQLIRERREGIEIVHRGTQLVDVDALATSAKIEAV